MGDRKGRSSLTYACILAAITGLGLTLAVTWLLSGGPRVATFAQSGSGVIRVAPTGEDAQGCGSVASPCRTVQFAVDQALPGEEIRVAGGVYAGVQNVPSLNTGTFTATQVLVITKNLTIRGGYTGGDWAMSDPDGNPSVLDAEGQGRVLVISGPISATIEGLHITNGGASGLGGRYKTADGGGIYVLEATVTISHCTIYSNAASSDKSSWDSGSGGGLYLESSGHARLLGNVIRGNTATWRGHGYGGGVLLLDSPNAILRSNVITDNLGTASSNGLGGGMYVLGSDDVIFDSNIICNNTGSLGANYYGGGLYLFQSDRATLTQNTIKGNVGGSAWSWGGGLFMDLCTDLSVTGNTIEGNVASTFQGWGGGLYATGCQDLDLSNNLILGNAGTSNLARRSWGGGLYIERGEDITLTNNVVVDNLATTSGGGLFVAGASPRLLHNTFARNSGGDGSAVTLDRDEQWSTEYFGTVAMTNTILVSHRVGISVTGGNTVTVNGVLWHNTPVTVSGALTAVITLRNQYTGDPRFAADEFHLTTGSAAANKGVEAGITIDIDGEPRPMGPRPDLGADELQQWVISLPLVRRD